MNEEQLKTELAQVREAYSRMEKTFGHFLFAVDDVMALVDPIIGDLKRKADSGKKPNIMLEIPRIINSLSGERVQVAGTAIENIMPVITQYKPFFEKKYERQRVGSGSDQPVESEGGDSAAE